MNALEVVGIVCAVLIVGTIALAALGAFVSWLLEGMSE